MVKILEKTRREQGRKPCTGKKKRRMVPPTGSDVCFSFRTKRSLIYDNSALQTGLLVTVYLLRHQVTWGCVFSGLFESSLLGILISITTDDPLGCSQGDVGYPCGSVCLPRDVGVFRVGAVSSGIGMEMGSEVRFV